MKQWKKSICIVAAVLAICVAAILSLGNETECCLCNAPTSSVPCLADLETGDILEDMLRALRDRGEEEAFAYVRAMLSKR